MTPIDSSAPLRLALTGAPESARAAAAGRSAGSPQKGPADPARAAQEFEAYLIKMLLEESQKTVGEGGLFGNETGAKGYLALGLDALSRRAAAAGSFGLARQLLEQWESGS